MTTPFTSLISLSSPRNEILGSDSDGDDEDDDDDEDDEDEEEQSNAMEITDATGANMQAIRRTIYLTIQVSCTPVVSSGLMICQIIFSYCQEPTESENSDP